MDPYRGADHIMFRHILFIVVALGSLVSLPGDPVGDAHAATIGVPGNAPTITAAMRQASRGDIILVGCGTYQEHDIAVKPGVSLWSGTLQPDCAIIDARGRGRVLVFDDCDSTTSVVGFTLRNGRSAADGGAILCIDSSPRLARCTIVDSHARRGGGLACRGNAAPRLEDCVFAGNTADLQGGGVLWNAMGDGGFRGCTLERNAALAGGGLACLRCGTLDLADVTIVANEAAASGGGVWIGAGAPELRRCLLAGNHGGLGGGALSGRGGRPRLVACTLVDNGAEIAGGAILVRAATPLLDRSIIAFNGTSAVSCVEQGRPQLTGCDIYGHRDGDWTGPLRAVAAQNGNFSGDPRFCDRASGRYDLRTGSPCLSGTRGRGATALIGARDHGCD